MHKINLTAATALVAGGIAASGVFGYYSSKPSKRKHIPESREAKSERDAWNRRVEENRMLKKARKVRKV